MSDENTKTTLSDTTADIVSKKDELYLNKMRSLGYEDIIPLHAMYDSLRSIPPPIDSPFIGYDYVNYKKSFYIKHLFNKNNLLHTGIVKFLLNSEGAPNAVHGAAIITVCDDIVSQTVFSTYEV